MDINIKCKNISISADIGGGGNIVYRIDRIWDIENIFVLAYQLLLTGSEIYKNKHSSFHQKHIENYKNER